MCLRDLALPPRFRATRIHATRAARGNFAKQLKKAARVCYHNEKCFREKRFFAPPTAAALPPFAYKKTKGMLKINVKLPGGVYPTMITPYNRDNTIDYGAVKELAAWYIGRGCHGIFAVCQSSELFILSLEEKINLTETVVGVAKARPRADGSRIAVVASGHTSLAPKEQARELTAVYEAGADAAVLISNRLDFARRGDEYWIAEAEELLSLLPSDVPLGIYECPAPYKRLLSPKILEWFKKCGRFRFIKNTCCDEATIENRLDILRGTDIGLYNANAQTLLPSLKKGACGYCGVMANFHPELYVWLYENYLKEKEKAEEIGALLSVFAFTESLPYPLTAKYHLSENEGIKIQVTARTRAASDLTDYAKAVVKQLNLLSKKAYWLL